MNPGSLLQKRSPGGDAYRKASSTRVAMGVATAVFFMWGFLTVLNDVLIPHLKALFSLDYTEIMLVQFTFFGAYFVMSIPSGRVVSAVGYKTSIVVGLLVCGAGALLFYPAAAIPSYALFLAALFVLASGITLLQVAANPYVSLLGPERTASSRLNLAQAFNSLGTTLAPMFGGFVILATAVLGADRLAALSPVQRSAYRAAQAHAVQGPYLGLAAVLFALAVIVYLFRLPSPAPEQELPRSPRGSALREVFSHRHALFGVIAIFVYVGAEVSLGSFMINYLSLPQIGDLPHSVAARYVALYWGGAMIGRFVGSALLRKINPRKLLGAFALVAGALVATTMLSTGVVAVWAIVLVGLFNSIMFPNIFTFGIARMGRLTESASSLMIMAIVGGAVIPLAQGAIADTIGLHHAFLLPLACYVYIVFYGFRGSALDPARAPAAVAASALPGDTL